MNNTEFTRSERNVLKAYGYELCAKAFEASELGNGTSTIRYNVVGSKINHRTVDCMINVGRKLTAQSNT